MKYADRLRARLDAYAAGRVARSVRAVDAKHATPEQLDRALRIAGFRAVRLAVPAAADRDGARRFLLRDGHATRDERHPGLVPHDVYVHEDGGVVHVHPLGDPSTRTPPWATKGVLWDAPGHERIGAQEQAFVVSDEGEPVAPWASEARIPLVAAAAAELPFGEGGTWTTSSTLIPSDYWEATEELLTCASFDDGALVVPLGTETVIVFVADAERCADLYAQSEGDPAGLLALPFSRVRLLHGAYVVHVEPGGRPASREQLRVFLVDVLPEIEPYRLVDDATGEDRSFEAERTPETLLGIDDH